ncbi:hypothetical protein R69888_00126 [Paraburkholderia haematera]|uniref:Uncharacterized protein n=1 Tax=Paraburkholderia haematera TaxID=2793077 RepID=A0ABN7KEH8_9BURK|nr:hypothetical protein R69888_00126 [Paraburkholderia haematera]
MLDFLNTFVTTGGRHCCSRGEPGSGGGLHTPLPEPAPSLNADYSTVGGCSNVWNGAGLGTVHSRPVAPSHGLSPAFSSSPPPR